jgi:biopolymer transport protein ExbB
LIKLLAAVAPLLGLLGTVTGMILTFQSISLFGTGDPKLMAGGISQALVTTVMGLVTAIPLLFLHTLLASRSRTLIQILDEQSAGVVAQRVNHHD